MGGPIGLLQDGDIIEIDAVAGTLNVRLTDAELAERKTKWNPRETNHKSRALWKYASRLGGGGRGRNPSRARARRSYADI
jgi:dihydroxy-acid dehydratase